MKQIGIFYLQDWEN